MIKIILGFASRVWLMPTLTATELFRFGDYLNSQYMILADLDKNKFSLPHLSEWPISKYTNLAGLE